MKLLNDLRQVIKTEHKKFKALPENASKEDIAAVLVGFRAAIADMTLFTNTIEDAFEASERISELITPEKAPDTPRQINMLKALALGAYNQCSIVRNIHVSNMTRRLPKQGVMVFPEGPHLDLKQGIYPLVKGNRKGAANYLIVLDLGKLRLTFTTRDRADLVTNAGPDTADDVYMDVVERLDNMLREFELPPLSYEQIYAAGGAT